MAVLAIQQGRSRPRSTRRYPTPSATSTRAQRGADHASVRAALNNSTGVRGDQRLPALHPRHRGRCMKILMRTEVRPRHRDQGQGGGGRHLLTAGVKMITSSLRRLRPRGGLKLKEAAGAGEVVVVCASPEAAGSVLREGWRGADRAVLVKDLPERAGGLARASILAAVARGKPDLILVGEVRGGDGRGADRAHAGGDARPPARGGRGRPHRGGREAHGAARGGGRSRCWRGRSPR